MAKRKKTTFLRVFVGRDTEAGCVRWVGVGHEGEMVCDGVTHPANATASIEEVTRAFLLSDVGEFGPEEIEEIMRYMRKINEGYRW